MRTFRLVLTLAFCVLGLDTLLAQPPAANEILLLDAGGKEHKLTGAKWLAGTRHLSWLAAKDAVKAMEPAEEPMKGKGPKGPPPRATVGPVALEFREVESTTFVDGVVTLISLERLQSLEFDSMKKTATATVSAGGKNEPLNFVGSTLYKGVNTPVLEAEVDRGTMGVAVVKFFGGVPTGGFQKATFPVKMAEAEKLGRPARVTINHNKKTSVQTVHDLQPLYQLGTGSEVLAPALLFKKSLKVDLANVRKMVGSNPGQKETSLEVTFKDGAAETLTAVNRVKLDGKEATLLGLVGKVPGGWKIYPLHTIVELEFTTEPGAAP